MGKIHSLKKWDLNQNKWEDYGSANDKKTSLSIASYKDITNSEDKAINYIIIADGHRVESVSNDGEYIKEKYAGIANTINYFEKKKENYRIKLLLVDKDAPLVEQSKEIARYIDSLAKISEVKTISFLGFSKCGAMALDMIKYLCDFRSYAKTRVYSVSSPYLGTLATSPILVKEEIKRMIETKIGVNSFSARIIDSLMHYYHTSLLSDSHMDLDIAIPGSVPSHLVNYYDPSFLQNIFSIQNIEASKKVAFYKNICTLIDDSTIKEVMKSGNLTCLGQCILNECFFSGKSDGLVHINSQRAIETRLNFEDNSSLIIPAPHHSLSIPIYCNEIMNLVNNNIDNPILIRKR